jgi:hypothetical protein
MAYYPLKCQIDKGLLINNLNSGEIIYRPVSYTLCSILIRQDLIIFPNTYNRLILNF